MVTLQKVELQSENSTKRLGREYIRKIAGGLLYRTNFCFCLDGTGVCLVSGDTFAVYRTCPSQQGTIQNGQAPKYFVSKSHDKRITKVISHPVDSAVVMSASEDGTLRIWDVEEGILQKTMDIGLPIENVLYDAKFTDTVYCLCRKLGVAENPLPDAQELKTQRVFARGRKLCKVISVQISTGKVSTIFQVKRPRCFCLASSERVLLVGTDYGLTCYFLDKKDNRLIHMRHSKPINTMAYHEETDTLAVGEETGMIRIFRCFMATFSRQSDMHPIHFLNAQTHSKFHWHSQTVLSLAFSVNGVRLFSGGTEGVLVSWKVSTGEHTFLPRLGGSIRYLMVDAYTNTIGISSQDNCFKLLDGSNSDLVCEVRGAWSWTAYRLQRKDRQALESKDGWMDFVKCIWTASSTPKLLLPGRPGRLQIFDIMQDRHFMEVDLFYFNYQPTCAEDAKWIPFISHLCVLKDLSSIITLERRFVGEDKSFPSEFGAQMIQFYELESSHYVLKSRMYIQSKDSFIVDIFCHPREAIVCTLHQNGSFRIWARKSDTQERQQTKWYCIHTSKGCQTATAIRGTFSSDGSLLLIGYNNLISFWKLDENITHISLLSEKSFDVGYIVSLHCLGGNCGILIVATCSSFLVVDLIQMEMLWSQHVLEPVIACDDFSCRFAVVYKSIECNGMPHLQDTNSSTRKRHHKICIYEPFSVDPLQVLDAKGISIKAVFFSLNHFNTFNIPNLILVDSELQIYGCYCTQQTKESTYDEKKAYHREEDSAYFSILGEKLYHRESIHPSDNIPLDNSNSNKPLEFQDVPSHVLPTPHELLDNLFQFPTRNIHSTEESSNDDLATDVTLDSKPILSLFTNAFRIDERNHRHYGQRLWKKLFRLNHAKTHTS
ncbi:hypothetical protein GpartN1_g1154.t1 [Galdieria partita]|uniref:WD repeat-containing protein 75 second beta-propeller domain-containing protein n=1 Tax=Galdieria partita TaxID=83374 RepID=A0A9C7PRG8_9RHOD|nr:hypothetical protein GpartN1_g1154.t1 [Galdieria partita]